MNAFSSAFNCCVSSYCDNPAFTLCLQASLSVALASHESVFMPSAWRSRLHTSMKRSWGRPVGLFPVASSPYKRSFGMRPSFIHVTCPSHRMRLWFKRVYRLGIPASLSVAVTSQESVFMPNAWRSRLYTSLKRSWGRHVGLFPVASLPYKRSF